MLRSGDDARGGRVTATQVPSTAAHSQVKIHDGKWASSKNSISDGTAVGANSSSRDCDLNGDDDNSEEIEDENEELSEDEDEGTEGYKKGTGRDKRIWNYFILVLFRFKHSMTETWVKVVIILSALGKCITTITLLFGSLVGDIFPRFGALGIGIRILFSVSLIPCQLIF